MKRKITFLAIIMLLLVILTSCGLFSKKDTGTETEPESHVHAFGAWDFVELPNCTENGLKERVCSCGEKETSIIDAYGHSFDNLLTGKEHLMEAATCSKQATYYYSCLRCGANGTETFSYGSFSSHDWDDGTETDGRIEYHCRNCTEMQVVLNQKTKVQASINKSDLLSVGAIELKNATIVFDEDTLNGLGDDVSISADIVSEEKLESILNNLTLVQQNIIGSNPVFDLSMGDEPITFDGKVTVTVPYTLKEDEDPNDIVILYLNDFEVEMLSATYSNGYVTFETNHFSLYVPVVMSAEERCAGGLHDFAEISKTESTCTTQGTASKQCIHCGKEETEQLSLLPHQYNKEVVSETYLKSAATCTQKTIYYKSCECGANGTETFEVGEALGHTYADEYTCHDRQCQNCEHVETATTEHTFDSEYTCIDKTCTVCETVQTAATEHNFNQEIIAEKYLASEATGTEGAKYYYSCICGAKGENTFDADKPHVHTFADEYTCHDRKCQTCDYIEVATTNHTFESEYTCIDKTCTVCGTVQTATTEHNFNQEIIAEKYLASEATDTEGAKYYYSCICGAKGENTFITDKDHVHTYADEYTCHDRQCQNCEHVETATTEHTLGSELTCIDRTCTVCGTVQTATTEHVFDQEITTEECLASVVSCTEKAKYYYSCLCGEKGTETFEVGEMSGHSYADEYTCHDRQCQNCEHIEEASTQHNFSGNICSDCGYEKEEEQTPSEGLAFTLSEDETYYILTGIGTCTDNDIVIPSTHNNLPVTSIGSYAFDGCSGLTSIVIPDSVTSIGEDAFYNCNGLTSITIGNSVTSIGEGAFENCSGLTSVTIGNSVTSIGSYAFYNCSGLTSITIPFVGATKDGTSKTHFGYIFGASDDSDNSDYVPSSLKSVTITGGTSIGSSAFYECSGLTSVTIGNSVTSIGSYAFYYCRGLTSVTIGNSVTSIGYNAFYYCSQLTYYEYDNGYYLGNENNHYVILMKAKNTSITSCTIHENTKVIYGSAFSGCSGLTSIVIPDSVTSIGSYAFKNCSGLTSVTFSENSQLTSIGTYAFQNSSGLTSIAIPDSVTSIGTYAFSGCNGLLYNKYGNGYYLGNNNNPYVVLVKVQSTSITSCTIHADTKIIGNRAFLDCSNMTAVIFDGNSQLISIGDYAFYNCRGLTSVTIGNGVTSIGEDAFYGCSGLKEVHISDIAKWCGISFGGGYANPSYYTHNLYLNDTLITDLVIPDSVTSIGSYAFYNCRGLTSVTIGNGVTSIGSSAFQYCSGLKEVHISDIAKWCGISFGNSTTNPLSYAHNLYLNDTLITDLVIPDSVTSIGSYAFEDCSGLTSIIIPDSVTNIDSHAFEDCSGLTSVTIGNSVTSIDEGAFRGCSGLKEVHISDIAKWCGISFGNYDANPLYYAHNLYLNDTLITDLVIPDSVTSIGSYAFYGCSGLTSITIPDSVTSIGSYAFEDCSRLQKVHINDLAKWCTIIFDNEYSNPLCICNGYLYLNDMLITDLVIPDNVTSIGSYAFYGCIKIISIAIPNSVINIGQYAFKECCNLLEIYNASSLSITIGSTDKGFVGYYAKNIYTPHNGNSKLIIDQEGYRFFTDESNKILVGYSGEGKELIIPTDTTAIIQSAFLDCCELTSLTLSFETIPSNTYLGYVFGARRYSGNSDYVPSSLKSVTITCGMSIGSYAFYSCSGLTSIEIPDSVTSIGRYAFLGCSGLTSVTIGNSVTSIGDDAFWECSGLKEVHISDIAKWCGISFGNSTTNPLSYAHNLYLNDTLITDLVIPDSVTSIGSYAFYKCSGLTSIVIPDSVTSIGKYAFYGCSRLTSIVIPDSVTSIGSHAFEDCSGLTTITLPFVGATKDGTGNTLFGYIFGASVFYFDNSKYVPSSLKSVTITGGTSIGSCAFYGCSGLTSIVIPDSVTSIGSCAFSDCSGLTSINVSVENTKYHSSNNCLIETSSKTLIAGCKTSIIPIDGSVTSIGNYAFYYCSGLTSIVIPDSVTSIGSHAFEDCSGLTSIILPFVGATKDGTSNTHFGYIFGASDDSDNSDYVPSSLKSVTITGGTSIGKYAFYYCSGLTSIVIPDSVTSIGETAFSRCSGLTSIVIPDSVTSIGKYAFYYCSGLTSINIGSGVKYFYSGSAYDDAQGVFYGCSGLTTINVSVENTKYHSHDNCIIETTSKILVAGCKNSVIPTDGSVTSIDSYAFGGCIGLTSITIPDSITSIDSSAFRDCTGLTSINIGSGVEYFASGSYLRGQGVFCGCSGLTTINVSVENTKYHSQDNCIIEITSKILIVGCKNSVIPTDGSVTSIGNYAFEGCSGLTSIVIPDSVTSIGYEAFYKCSGLKEVHISDIAKWCGISFGGNPLSYAHNLYLNDTLITDLVIPDSVTSIGDDAFEGCSGLTSITIPDSATSIGWDAFRDCSGLTSIVIPDSVTSIDSYAFHNCSGLTSVAFGENSQLTSIGEDAFSGCSGLTSIVIPDSVRSIGSHAFEGCSGLKEVHISDIAKWCGISFGSYDANPLYYAQNLYLNDTLITDLVIPDSVTSISSSAFKDCSGLTSIVIPDSVTSISSSAFKDCSGLTSITIPFVGATKDGTSNTHFGYIFGASVYFDNSKYVPSSLKSVTITGGTSIGYKAFSGCSGLTSIVIPDSVTSIGSYAFSGCSGLTSVTFGANSQLTSIGSYAFRYCSGLTSIIIPDSVTNIDSHAFEDCSGLTSVTIGNSVTSIDEGAFRGCSGLKEVHISDIAKWCGISFGNYDANPLYYAHNLYLNDTLITDLVVPDSVTSIGDYAFRGCSGLISIVIPDSVTSIGDYAFSYCYRLVEVYNKSTLPITKGSHDYGHVGYYAKEVYTSDYGSKLSTDKDGYIIYTDGTDKILIGYTGQEKDLFLPTDITEIYQYAFYERTDITSIVIPYSVTSIGSGAFYNCSGLTSITIPFVGATKDGTSNTHFGYIFGASDYSYNSQYVPSSLKSVTITGGTSIGSDAFRVCSGLTSIEIPNSVTSIGKYAFYYCSGLKKVYYNGTSSERTQISIGSSNGNLTNATWYYYSDNEPTDGGNYWRYDTDGVTVLEW